MCDWLRPRSVVVVHSIETGATLQYRYDQENSKDRTEIIGLDLPAGLTQVSVSVGRGTLLTHTAGHLVQTVLENPAPYGSSIVAGGLQISDSAQPALFDFSNLGTAPDLSQADAYYSIPWASSIVKALPSALASQCLSPFAA